MKINRILSSALCAAVLCGTVYADSVNVSYNPETELININGSFDKLSESTAYSVQVKKLSDDTVVYTTFDYAKGNAFDFSFMLDGVESDEYYVSVMPYTGDGANSKENPIFISSASEKDNILKNVLSNQTDKSVMAGLLDANLKYFGLNKNNCDYFNLSASSKQAAAERMLNKSYSYDKYGEFLDLLNLTAGIEMLDNADESTVTAVFEKYFTYFDLTGEVCYPIYSGSDKGVKNQTAVKAMAVKNFVGKDLTDLKAVKKYFNENLLLAAISNIVSPGEITTHIENYKTAISFSLDVYNSTDKAKTASYISGLKRSYTLMSTLESDIVSAKNAQSGGGQGGGSSSGKGSGGSSSSGGFYSPGETNGQNEQKGSFNDMTSAHWAYETVEALKAKGVVSGDQNGNFNPENNITREEFAKMIVLAFGLYDENAECAFADTKDHWSYRYVASLYKNGITNGIDADTFGVGLKITREDMATLCAKAAKLAVKEGALSFADASDVSDYASGYVASLCESGAVKGFEDNTFKPKNNATRAEASSVIYSLIK